jgi:PII-like signaling protein
LSGGEMLQLRFYFGERDRTGDGERPLEAAVVEACARRGVSAAALLRGVTGFGAKHGMRTDRLLTLSEDAPLVAVAVGDAEVVEALAAEVRGMAADGLVTVEPVRAVGGRDGGSGGVSTTGTATTSAAGVAASGADAEEAAGSAERDVVKVTIWGPRSGSESPHVGAVAALHRCGAEAATVLLGVDGVLCGERRRARFVGANRSVPATTVAVGERAKIDAALGEIDGAHFVTAEPVVTYRRIATVSHHVGVGGVVDSSRIERESHHGNAESAAPAEATRVTLVTSEIASHDGRPTYLQFVDALRREGAPGATALRGVWGFRGGGTPRGDRVLALRRDVPVLIEVVDRAARAERWRELALSVAGEDDIVESGSIPRILTLE